MTPDSGSDDGRHRVLPAILASSVVPGWGHLYLGRRRAAQRLLIVDGVLILTGAVAVIYYGLGLLKLAVSDPGLVLLMLLNVAVLGYRVLVTVDVTRTESSRPGRWIAVMGWVVAGTMLLAPHVTAGYLIVSQFRLINSVFPESEPVAAPSTVTSSSLVDAVTSTSMVGTTTPPATTTTTSHFWDGFSRLNVVLLGADAGAGRTGLRTDTTIVVSIDPATGDTVMISIPRNLSNAPLPEGMGSWDCDCFPDLITHLWDAAERDPAAFPGPGEAPINAIKGAVGQILGLPIHYYALVTLDGFVAVVDALGGVTIDVPVTIIDETYPHENGTVERVVIEKGLQHLDGHLALAYARIRRHSDDFARMHRQRCVVEAVIEQAGPTGLLLNFGSLVDAIVAYVRTDIPQDRLTDLVDLIPKIETDRIISLRIAREYQTGTSPGRTYYDIERIQREVQALLADPAAARRELGLDPLDATCADSFD